MGDRPHFLRRCHANDVSMRDGGGTYSAYGLMAVAETYYLGARGRIAAEGDAR